MTPAERYAWILAYLKARGEHYTVSITDAYFVDCYADECKPAVVRIQMYGAHSVPQLGRDLSAMFKAGTLERYVCGLGDMHSMGFPAWVYQYHTPRTK